jgi:hypothetical protein
MSVYQTALSGHPSTLSLSWPSSTVCSYPYHQLHAYNMHTASLPPSWVLCPWHTPIYYFPYASMCATWPFQGPYPVTLFLSSIWSPWFSERASKNWWAGFQGPFCFYSPTFSKFSASCYFLLCLLFNHNYGGDIFLWNICCLWTDYTALIDDKTLHCIGDFSRIQQLPTLQTFLWWLCEKRLMVCDQQVSLFLPHVIFVYGVVWRINGTKWTSIWKKS